MAEEKEEKGKYTTVSIPTPLAEKIKKRIEGTGFNSISSYVTYVLRELLASMEEEEKEEVFSKEDEEKIKERLRALGYLD
ncbi:MAG TPA: CopG family transcriptional regulator [Thermoplasmatales archaeon]|nr:CopG family transcriptional regulator [Thermoplasmatales archaeon]